MPSTLTWLDTTTQDQRRALDVINLFGFRDTVDQLGIGSIRDAWAERLSPGTSTIQTRARYFFFVPWIYRKLHGKGDQPKAVAARARRLELELVDAILASDEDGVPIGARVGRGLKQLPSTIYWAGLGRFGIRLWQGSQPAFHRALPDLGGDAWHPHLPPAPDGFLKRSALSLEAVEARFLREQLRQHAQGSLLQFLMDHGEGVSDAALPWDHPLRGEFGSTLSGHVDHAEAFAVLMHGSALLYNLMLAERLAPSSQLDAERLVDTYRSELAEWATDVAAWRSATPAWNRQEFWGLTHEINQRIPPHSYGFCETWLERVLGTDAPFSLVEDKSTRALVENREHRLKGNRSRLRNREQLERWGGRSGTKRIDYRWGITRRYVRDVHEGLARA